MFDFKKGDDKEVLYFGSLRKYIFLKLKLWLSLSFKKSY